MIPQRLSLILIGFALAGCGTSVSQAGADNAPVPAPQTLEHAEAVWDSHATERYQVTVQQTCFCPEDMRQPIRVTVSAGEVVTAEGLEQPLQNRNLLDNQRLTVAGLFLFIEQSAAKDPHRLEVVYDARYGFPRRIDYDGHEMIADDEFQYELSDFRAGGAD
ncbi:DUF6174 domain-containing protein [Marinobacter salarius]|uniref:DUF6174 domain-containing protein n=1 Tax=Marinobacter salarius TaxID=1420917 RepID=UPI0010A9A965|nr:MULTISPECIES: DUF6174 domain-containing protein [Marinobacter]MBJ7301265.1 hypothetical protein [Marinobacter salarius]HIO31435.1 hypothetical protein [Marinobacter salarius]HIP00056.1 hypothetical protein [Marinobacter salarius]